MIDQAKPTESRIETWQETFWSGFFFCACLIGFGFILMEVVA